MQKEHAFQIEEKVFVCARYISKIDNKQTDPFTFFRVNQADQLYIDFQNIHYIRSRDMRVNN